MATWEHVVCRAKPDTATVNQNSMSQFDRVSMASNTEGNRMNLPTLRHALFLAAVFGLGTLPHSLAAQSSSPIFTDTFESGGFGHSQNGFRWGSPNRTSIVRDDGCAVHINPPRCVEGNPGEWENGPGVAGRHSMRFRYPALEPWSEQRFNIGGSYPELWMSFWIRVPINYVHENAMGTGDNNKLFALWADSYSSGPVIVGGLWRDPATNSTRFGIATTQTTLGQTGFVMAEGIFWRNPEDRGRWMHFVTQAKFSETGDTTSGLVRTWSRWEDATDYTLLVERGNYEFTAQPGGNTGWSGGYLMGWANSGYAETTEFLIDDVALSTQPLFAAGAAKPKPPQDAKAE